MDAVRDRQGQREVLLDQQDGVATRAQTALDLLDALHQLG